MKRTAGILAVTVLCLTGAACSGGGGIVTAASSSDGRTTSTDRSSSDTPSTDTGPTDTGSASDDTSVDTGYSDDTGADTSDSYLSDDSGSYDSSNHGAAADVALEHKLLAKADLPKGWTADIVSGDAANNTSDNGPECFKKTDRATPDARAGGIYQAPVGMTEIEEKVASYANGAEATFTQAVDRLKACTTFSYTTANGTKVTGKLLPAKLRQVGDHSQAFLGAISNGHQAVAVEVAYVRQGETLMSVSYLSTEKPDPTKFEALMKQAAAKL